MNERPCWIQRKHLTALLWLIYCIWLLGTKASRLNLIVTDKKFMAEKIQDKHSISPLRDMLLYLQRKWKDNLSGCTCTAGLNQIIFPTYCESKFDLFISVQTNNQIFTMYGHKTHEIYATNHKRNKEGRKSSLRVLFNSPSEQCNPLRNKMPFILSWPRRSFIAVTMRMPTWSMVHETASFYWHGIQSVSPGYMSLALQWGPPITALPAPAHVLLPNPILCPLPHHFHPCINTISPVKKGTTTYFFPLLFLIDYAEYLSIPPHVFEFHWSWLDAKRSSPILLIPSLWPHTVLTHPYITLRYMVGKGNLFDIHKSC